MSKTQQNTKPSLASEFLPKIVTVIKEGYSKEKLISDILAGILVGVIALPLAVAFAVASGCSPQQGIVTGIIAGFLISLFSGSRVQIGGPTGAFIVLVATVVAQHGMVGLTTATVMAGIMLLLFGIFRFGSIISYIPYPVTIGFTSAISLIILSGQIQPALGLVGESSGPEFIAKMRDIASSITTFSPTAFALTAITMAIIVGCRKISSKIPGSLIAILVLSLVAKCFDLDVQVLGDKFGEIKGAFPKPILPSFSYQIVVDLLPSALAIALLGGIESLLSAVVADGMTGFKHRSNAELIAQGVANVITPLFGGIPATGAIARTATNIKNGGRTPLAGIVHAITLLVLFVFAGSLVSYIPFSVLSGILILVSFGMGEWHLFKKLLLGAKSDAAVLLTTFLLTLFLDLSIAIPVGVVLASMLFMKRMTDISDMGFLNHNEQESPHTPNSDGVEYFTITGPFFFGVANRFSKQIKNINPACKKLVIDLKQVPALDATGLSALENVVENCAKRNIEVVLTHIATQPQKLIKKSKVLSAKVLKD